MWLFQDGTGWTSDAGGRFVLAQWRENPVKCKLPLERLIEVRYHPKGGDGKRCAANVEGAVFPGEFKYCPVCGAPLDAPHIVDDQLWRPPFGHVEGSKLVERLLPLDTALHTDKVAEQVPLPDRFAQSALRFVVSRLGARHRVLLGIDPHSGHVAVYSQYADASWCKLDSPVGPSALPDWAWTVAYSSDERLLAVPDESGIHLLEVDWTNLSLRKVLEKMGRCLAGPGVLLDGGPGEAMKPSDPICVPFEEADGSRVLLWWREKDGQGDWRYVALPKDIPSDEAFGQPASPGRRLLVWPGRRGVLSVKPPKASSPDSEPEVKWTPWPCQEGCSIRGLPELGPMWRDEMQQLWQVCEEIGGGRRGDEITIRRIRVDDMKESKELEYGDILSTGYLSFSRYHDHWTSPDKYGDNEPERESLRFPLVQFQRLDEATRSTRPGKAVVLHLKLSVRDIETVDLSRVLQHEWLEGDYWLELAGPSWSDPPVKLKLPDNAKKSMSVKVFKGAQACVFDNRLWVYFPYPGRIYRWSIASEAGTTQEEVA